MDMQGLVYGRPLEPAVNARDHRRALIKLIVQERDVSSQDELQRLLEERGVEVTQATLSRDLRDLNVHRRNTPGGPVYRIDRQAAYYDALRRVVGMEILQVRHNGVLVVVRTLSGRAEGVAGFLDSWGNPLLLGTVAGDDTVFVAPASTADVEELARQIQSLSSGAE